MAREEPGEKARGYVRSLGCRPAVHLHQSKQEPGMIRTVVLGLATFLASPVAAEITRSECIPPPGRQRSWPEEPPWRRLGTEFGRSFG